MPEQKKSDAKKPVIGIVLDSQRRGSFSHRPHYALRKGYFEAVELAGGIPVGVPTRAELAGDYAQLCDGFIIAGGDCAFPEDWYVDGRVSGYPENPERLAFEVGFIQQHLANDTPILAICHGMQILSHVLGGKLSADVSTYLGVASHRTEADKPITHHDILLQEHGKLLHGLEGLEHGRTEVNSHHKEAVVEIDENLVAARAADGVIEAVESPNHRFVLGVQWHPELMLEDAFNLAVLRQFVAAATR